MPDTPPKPDKLNDHTKLEIAQLRLFLEKQKAEKTHTGHCAYCDKQFEGRADRKFCSAKHRSLWHSKMQLSLIDSLRHTISALELERDEYVREASGLRRRVEELEDCGVKGG